jgi:uncharacterized protein (UPF0335 family)
MSISVNDLAHSKGMPTAATETMLIMASHIKELEAENERLREEVQDLMAELAYHGVYPK